MRSWPKKERKKKLKKWQLKVKLFRIYHIKSPVLAKIYIKPLYFDFIT